MPYRTVFVADNDQAICELFAEVLSAEGYTVMTGDGTQLSPGRIGAAQPDLALLELLPVAPTATLTLLEQLRAHPATAHLPVLLSSTNEQLLRQLAEPLRRLGCQTLLKPCSLDDLIETVGRAARC